MTIRKRKDIESALVKKGFSIYEQADHRFYFYHLNEIQVVRTKVSHGTKHKDIGDKLLSAMARQCRLNKADFLNLIDCPISKEEYENILKKQGIK